MSRASDPAPAPTQGDTPSEISPGALAGRVVSWVRPSWMNHDLKVVLAARLAMSAARALATVVVPLYLATKGYTGLRLGELFFAAAVVSLVLSTTIGLAADRVGRKPFLVATPFLVTAAGAVFALLTSDWVLFAAAALGGVGRGAGAGAGAVGPYQPAESALVTDAVDARWRNDVFGRLAFVSGLGALGGGLLAIAFAPDHPGAKAAFGAYRPAFVALAVLGAIAGLAALWIVEPGRTESAPARPVGTVDTVDKGGTVSTVSTVDTVGTVDTVDTVGTVDTVDQAVPRTTRRHRDQGSPWFPRRSLPLLMRLWITNGVNGFAIGMFGPFVTYWLYRRFGAGVGTVGLLFALTNALTLGASLIAPALARRFRSVRTVTVVRVIQSVLLIPIALAPTFWVAGALYIVRMFAQRVGLPLRQSYVLAMADPDERSSVAALSNVTSQGAMAVSPVLAGYLFDEVSLSLPFELGGVLQLVNAVMYFVFFHDAAPEEERARDAARQQERARDAAPAEERAPGGGGTRAGP